MAESEIARFKKNYALERQAAQRGLNGLAIVANHASITARMEKKADRLLRLIEEGKFGEVKRVMDTPEWSL